MGNGMNKVLPGLYVGNYRDSKDHQQLDRYNITHIIAIHDSPRRLLPDKHYLCVMAADTPDQNLSQYFSVCNDFIHAARLRDGNVLIHCLAGMSRSVTVAVAYIMTCSNLNWKEALKVVRAGRAVANPNLGFQTQLQDFEMNRLAEERRRLRERFPSVALEQMDRDQCTTALCSYEEQLLNKDICEGNCSRTEKCPTGLCNTDNAKGIFRRKTSSASMGRSRLTPIPDGAQSCPTSPKYSHRQRSQRDRDRGDQPRDRDRDRDRERDRKDRNVERSQTEGGPGTSRTSNGLTRSASTISNIRPRSSPAGLYSYTGSAPTSVHGSRVDLATPDKGSAIYIGCAPPKNEIYGSTKSIVSARVGSSSASTPLQTPTNTPPVSPSKQAIKRSSSVVKKK
ncbi:dual specificity protein phosphatase 15 isoform X4 [Hermetia illucens]|uniref:dual specificity protein phosphatase 15 isoform X4 n=1 Tax=Hermetia illucens TaxID=343691 RepID=UPI0018CC21A2|nr:dual specificity protein phosphatase 15 isoform X4 [Hermetia illucens]